MKQALLVLAVVFALAALSACVGGAPLVDRQRALQSTQWAAGQTAEAIGDYIQATAAAAVYQTAEAGFVAASATQNAAATQEARARATATADAASAMAATLAAAKTREALAVRGRELELQATAAAAQYQERLRAEELKREEATTRMASIRAAIDTFLWRLLVVLVVLLVFYAGVRMVNRRAAEVQVIPRAPSGLLPALVDGRGNVQVPDRQVWSDSRYPQPPLDAQTRLNHDITRVQAVAALGAASRAGLPAVSEMMTAPEQAQPEPGGDVVTAEWRWLEENWRGGPLPLGMGEGGLITANSNLAPHLMFVGTSGAGKTKSGIRPVVTAALADGQQVIVLDRSGVDFAPFREHPNCTITKIDEPVAALTYLAAAGQELQRRLREMSAAGVSTWDEWRGAARLMVVLDEISNLSNDMSAKERELLWRRLRSISAEGRKAGVTLVMGLQDTTARSIDPPTKRNSTRIAFHVVDSEASRIFIGAAGAETLPVGDFLANIVNVLVRGRGFYPSDSQIRTFLADRHTPALPAPAWLEEAGREEPGGVDDDIQIIELYRGGASLAEIQRRVYGRVGGSAYYDVREALHRAGIVINDSSTGSTTIESE